jgi:hypothetical protein
LYVGTRSSQPTGVIMPSSSDSSACSGTRDCTKIVARFGSSPAASQSVTISQTLAAISSGDS